MANVLQGIDTIQMLQICTEENTAANQPTSDAMGLPHSGLVWSWPSHLQLVFR